MSLGLRHRFRLRYLAVLALGLPFVLQGACGSNADQVGGTGGAGGASEGGADGGGGAGGAEPDAEEEPEVPMSVCPKDPIVTLAGTGQVDSAAQPAIAWAGAGYLVVWEDARNGGSIYGAMVDAKGMRTAGNEADILIADTAGKDGSAEVLALPDAAGFMVAFESCTGANCTVDTIVLGADGRPAAGAISQTISPAINVQRRPYLAAGFGKIYVTFRDRVMSTPPAVVARVGILDAAGALTGPGVLADMTTGEFPHVAVSDIANMVSKVAVVFKKDTAGVEDIVLTQFDPELTNPVEVPVRSASVGNGTPLGTSSASNPVVQWNTNAWLVAWEDERNDEAQIFAATVDDATSAVSTARLAYEENGNWPTIATGGRNTSLIGFYGYPGQRVFLSRISADTGLRPGQVVLDSGKFPAVAYNKVSTADEYAVVYENDKARNVMFGTFTCASAQ